MALSLPRRTAAVTALAVAAFGGVALAGSAVSAGAVPKAHTSLSIRAAQASINPGGSDVIGGNLNARGGHVDGRRIELLSKVPGATAWTTDSVRRTDRRGTVGFEVTPSVTTRYT